jgi:restriction system protein
MSNFSRRPRQPEPPKSQQREQLGAEDHIVPAIPVWIKDWGVLLLAPAALAALGAIAHISDVYGVGYGWALLVISGCATVALWWQGYSRRAEAAKARREQALYELHEITKVGGMTWRQFEEYCADLLRARGYRNVLVIGSTDDDDGVDIIATTPDGTRVAVQCKHRKSSIKPDVIRELIGSITSGKHHGLCGIVMTNARATSGAHARAKDHGIIVVDRPVLQQWMGQARTETEQRGRVLGTRASLQTQGMRPASKITAAVLSSALVLLVVIALQHPSPRLHSKTASPRARSAVSAVSAASGPGAVVMEAFTAINHHDWRTLRNLWSHSDSSHDSTYRKMIAGYRLTERDVVMSLKASGDAVSARVLAYETTGAVQTYDFSYRVHAGKITWGRSVLLGTSHPQRKAPSDLAQPPIVTALSPR